ncbi:hypothetical protein AB0C52_05890 [Streptomyces sp. NPDC048717]|uniref:hypothetical protein n=1 Tax=Streptomyces sp. NPDC048717 TaxID=3154928 RepID=UPI00341C88DC
MTSRGNWDALREDTLRAPEAAAGYEAARVRFKLGRAVRERREALERLAAALGMRLRVGFEPRDQAVG